MKSHDTSSIETRLIHTDRPLNSTSAVSPPIFQTATFRSDSAADFTHRSDQPRHPEFYARYGNPNASQVESVLAALEGAVRPNTRLMIAETPSNPLIALTDLRAVASIARARGITTLVDSTFATPINQRPLDLGFDLVFHSATKYFGGHSDLLAGVIMGSKEWIDRIWNTHIVLGAVLGPFDAWLILRGLRTLSLRVQRHNENAMALAKFLEGHRAVNAVHYPGLKSHPQHELACKQMSGFGGMLSFDVKGGMEAADRVLDRLRLVSRATSLGSVESLAVNAAANFLHYMTLEQAAKLGITPGLLRISVGLEGIDDLIADFDQALS